MNGRKKNHQINKNHKSIKAQAEGKEPQSRVATANKQERCTPVPRLLKDTVPLPTQNSALPAHNDDENRTRTETALPDSGTAALFLLLLFAPARAAARCVRR